MHPGCVPVQVEDSRRSRLPPPPSDMLVIHDSIKPDLLISSLFFAARSRLTFTDAEQLSCLEVSCDSLE